MSPRTPELPIDKARRIAVHAQRLDNRSNTTRGKNGILATIQHLGYIQLDTISVVNRAHHCTLWSRLTDYKPENLHKLQAFDRAIFEYWGHAASLLPIEDYPHYLHRMHQYRNGGYGWEGKEWKTIKDIAPDILKRVEKEGPLASRHFKPPPGKKRGTWWDWKPAKKALEHLFWQGRLLIDRRENFQRFYNIPNRVLPEIFHNAQPSNRNALGEFLIHRALRAHAIASRHTFWRHLYLAGKGLIFPTLDQMLEDGRLIKISIPETKDIPYYTTPEVYEKARRLRKTKPQLHLLNPFDNFIIQRTRLEALFNFRYRLECYVPAEKREHGYFVFPILWGDRLVARLDPKADRKNRTLHLQAMHFEDHFRNITDFAPQFAEKVVSFARFNDCDKIILHKTKPSRYKKPLQKALKEQSA